MRVQYSSPVAGLSAIRCETFQQLFGDYERRLLGAGYHHTSVRLQLQSIAHFGVWCEREDRRLETIDDQTLEAFERHRSTCRCPGTSRNRTRQVRSCVRGFLRHLRARWTSSCPMATGSRLPCTSPRRCPGFRWKDRSATTVGLHFRRPRGPHPARREAALCATATVNISHRILCWHEGRGRYC